MLTITGCGGTDTTDTAETDTPTPTEAPADDSASTAEAPGDSAPADSAPADSAPADSAPADSAPAQPTEPQAAAPTDGVTYSEPSGLFEISFPEGYDYQETGSGIVFISSDQQFGGSIDFGSAQGNQLDNSQLETALKEEYENRLTEVQWQGTESQPDGSVRIDWIGTDPQGNRLDSVSFVEQHGDNIFILNLHGINTQYANYNTEAQAIVNTYQVAR